MGKNNIALPVELREAIDRRNAIVQLLDLIVCLEFYYNHRIDYTNKELDVIENTVLLRKYSLDLFS